jgi:hypothetical protein
LTGHKTQNAYRRYAIVAESDLREAEANLGGAPPTLLTPSPNPLSSRRRNT